MTSYAQAVRLDRVMMNAFRREMHARGTHVNPAWHHAVSAMRTDQLIDRIAEAAIESARALKAVRA